MIVRYEPWKVFVSFSGEIGQPNGDYYLRVVFSGSYETALLLNYIFLRCDVIRIEMVLYLSYCTTCKGQTFRKHSNQTSDWSAILLLSYSGHAFSRHTCLKIYVIWLASITGYQNINIIMLK